MDSAFNSYNLEQNNKRYILTSSIQGDSIKITCKNELEPQNLYIRNFTLESLKKLDAIFDKIKTPLEAMDWIDKAVKIKKIRVVEDNTSFKIVFNITTKSISNQVEIPMPDEGKFSSNINTNIITGTGDNILQETVGVTKTIKGADFIREIGLDPSKVVRQTINEDTAQIIQSIENEKRKSLSQINFKLGNIYNDSIPLEGESFDINTLTKDNNAFIEDNYQVHEETKNIIPEITTESTTKNEETNFDLNQFSNIQNQYNIENIAQYTESLQETNAQGFSNQFNFEENQISTIPEVNLQYTEVNQLNNIFDSNQVPLPETTDTIQTSFDSKQFLTTTNDNIEQINPITIPEINSETTPLIANIENIDQGLNQPNYEEFQNTYTETQLDTQNLINTEFNITETQNIQDYGIEQIEPNINFMSKEIKENEADSLKSQIEELHILNSKVDELIGLKSQFEEINNLKAQINKINLRSCQNEELNYRHDNEKEILIKKSQELENLIEQYKQEIENIKENKIAIEENSEMEQNQHLIHEKIIPYSVKGEIIHNKEELELITKQINKINKKVILNLLYKATVDSDKAEIFHQKCDGAQSSLVLVETDKGKRFGGFTTSSWSGDCLDKKDEDSFVFSLDKLKVYKNIPGEDAIGCYPKFGPIFLGCQIRIYDNAFTKGGTTFEKGLNFETEEDYELTGGDREFVVKEIEVYEVIVESSMRFPLP